MKVFNLICTVLWSFFAFYQLEGRPIIYDLYHYHKQLYLQLWIISNSLALAYIITSYSSNLTIAFLANFS